MDHRNPTTVVALVLLDGPAPTYDEFVAAVAGRLPVAPRYRQTLREVPFGLGPAEWIDDERFDVRWHVRAAHVAPPGDDEQLQRLLGRVVAQRMDRDRPLWEYWLADGLADGRWAVVVRAHHALVDDDLCRDLHRMLLDPTPTPRSRVPDRWRAAASPNPWRVTADGVSALVRTPARYLPAAAAVLAHPRRTADGLRSFATAAMRFAAAMLPADELAGDGPAARRRRFTWLRVGREDVLTVRRAFGCTTSDLALALVTNGLREVLLAHGEPPRPHAVRVLPDAADDAGLPSAFLPVHQLAPAAQLVDVARRLDGLRPGRLVLARDGDETLTTVTTGTPGVPGPVYVLGRRATDVVTYLPVVRPARIGVTLHSYCGGLTLGVTGAADAGAELDVLVAGARTALTALVRAAATRPAQDPDPAPDREPGRPAGLRTVVDLQTAAARARRARR